VQLLNARLLLCICYLPISSHLLTAQNPNQFEREEFDTFIQENKDYTAASALFQLLEAQLIPQFFKVLLL
jgi:hypothetical protein